MRTYIFSIFYLLFSSMYNDAYILQEKVVKTEKFSGVLWPRCASASNWRHTTYISSCKIYDLVGQQFGALFKGISEHCMNLNVDKILCIFIIIKIQVNSNTFTPRRSKSPRKNQAGEELHLRQRHQLQEHIQLQTLAEKMTLFLLKHPASNRKLRIFRFHILLICSY